MKRLGAEAPARLLLKKAEVCRLLSGKSPADIALHRCKRPPAAVRYCSEATPAPARGPAPASSRTCFRTRAGDHRAAVARYRQRHRKSSSPRRKHRRPCGVANSKRPDVCEVRGCNQTDGLAMQHSRYDAKSVFKVTPCAGGTIPNSTPSGSTATQTTTPASGREHHSVTRPAMSDPITIYPSARRGRSARPRRARPPRRRGGYPASLCGLIRGFAAHVIRGRRLDHGVRHALPSQRRGVGDRDVEASGVSFSAETHRRSPRA